MDERLYEVSHDGDVTVVLAAGIPQAIRKWAAHHVQKYGPNSGWTEDDEPESIRLVSTSDLIK
jgi:hypothetical protein